MRLMRFLGVLPVCALAACVPAGSGARPKLVVHAAASLRDALQELAPAAEAELDAHLVFNFGASGDLARQILAGGAADVFFSADERELERVAAAGLLEPGTRAAPLANQLVVIEPAGRESLFTEPFEPAQLAAARLELLALGEPESVPAGRYARRWLECHDLWRGLDERILPCVDVRAALAAVETGEVRAGLVYATDAARSRRARIVYAVPLAEGPPVVYALAALAGRPDAERPRALAQYLTEDAALDVFERHGFVVHARRQ
jgi:molybdate transport system substrate-binding protein